MLEYRNPGLTVDLGVGLWAWPLPMDYDGDGDLDLVVVCPDKPSNGTYWFENAGEYQAGQPAMPIFEPAQRIDRGLGNVQLSQRDGMSVVTTPEQWYPDFHKTAFADPEPLGVTRSQFHPGRVRANQWKFTDLDGNGLDDLVVGVGDWTDYGWDDGFNERGEWTRGPLRGFVYWIPGKEVSTSLSYAEPVRLEAESGPVEVYGMPSPNFADWDRDGDLDLICGEFLDGFTYFENIGDKQQPRFADGLKLVASDQRALAMDLQMIVPVSVDWDRDGDMDLVVGDEDGRVAWCEFLSVDDEGRPVFAQPRYFQQRAERVKFGALVTPVSVDWDGDGDEDLICGNTAGYVGWIENLGGTPLPRWAAPRYLEVAGEPLRIQAGPNGSIQGPCEAKWGYTTLSVADWDGDSILDVIANSIWGRVVVYRGVVGDRVAMAEGEPVKVAWGEVPVPKPEWNWWQPASDELATQWRTTPFATDWNRDGLVDLIMLDHEGYLAYYERFKSSAGLRLGPGERIFASKSGASRFDSRHKPLNDSPGLLQLNANRTGASGRRKIWLGDWNLDGFPDLLVNSLNVEWFSGSPAEVGSGYLFEPRGAMTTAALAGHTTSPTLVDWDGDGRPALLIGAEDGFLYLVEPHGESDQQR